VIFILLLILTIVGVFSAIVSSIIYWIRLLLG
jgi:hypothetical protein